MKKIKINDELEVLFEMMPTDGVKFTNNTEKCVYAYMWFWSVDDRNVDGVFKMPMTALTNTLGICRKTASIMVASLVHKGCFEVVNKGSNLSKTASTYRFTLGLEKSIYTLNSNINRNRNFNSNRNGKDNGKSNINEKDNIGVVNNISVTQTENDIETTSPFLSQPIEVVSKEISWEELGRNPHTANTQPTQITTSISQGVEMVSNSCATVDDINDAIGSIALKTTHQSSKQEKITNLWNELRNGDNPEQAYSQLDELFKCGSLSDRQWETTNKIRSERLDAVKTTSNQKKVETVNSTLSYFPDDKMKFFNEAILLPYNACKTALDKERNEGKAFDEKQYADAFYTYAHNFRELLNEKDQYNNKYGDYDYLKRKVYLNPFMDRCDATTREICERYKSIQAKEQVVVNA